MTKKAKIKVLLAAPRGFCAGVVRAVDIARLALTRYGAPVYIRHEIVHNRRVVEELKEAGAVFVESLSEVPEGARVIFSAHGVSLAVRDEAGLRGLRALDATCPLVAKVHNEVRRHHRAGRHVLLIGHRGHPEVSGTMGQIPSSGCTLIETEADARSVAAVPPLAYATQTTLSLTDTQKIIDILRARFPAIASPAGRDICYATTNRQNAVRAIAGECDIFFVFGAPSSSNARRLAEAAREAGAGGVFLVESAGGVDWRMIRDGMVIGVTAGASAPAVLIEELLDEMAARYGVRVEESRVIEERVSFRLPAELAAGTG